MLYSHHWYEGMGQVRLKPDQVTKPFCQVTSKWFDLDLALTVQLEHFYLWCTTNEKCFSGKVCYTHFMALPVVLIFSQYFAL